MPKLKSPATLETAFGPYVVDEMLGEGGAGRVYGGAASDKSTVAIKVLAADRATTDRRRRFKNEIAFLQQNKHPNIVSVTDHGLATQGAITGPFYVMRRYDSNLRDLMKTRLPAAKVLPIFAKILDGVEAAHFQGAVHRDLKPENILFDKASESPAVADFGIASFTDDIVATIVETSPTQRLANFQYAAPEQRSLGKHVGQTADIYALGMMLNEMFTANIPYGTDYQLIGSVQADFAFLDAVVARAIKQSPSERYSTIAELKAAIAVHQAEFLTLQKISKIDATIVPAGHVDEPLAHTPPRLIRVDWNNGILTLFLDRPVTSEWIQALRNMGSFTSVMGIGPEVFQFKGNEAHVRASSSDAQQVINYFKEWLPRASQVLKSGLEEEARYQERELLAKLRREKAAEEERLKAMQNLRV